MARTVADMIRAVWELELGAMLYEVNQMGHVTDAGGGIVQLALAGGTAMGKEIIQERI